MSSVGVVTALRRFPVKSMQGEQLERARVGRHGVLGDRALAVVDVESGEVVRGKTPVLGPLILACRAAFTANPGGAGEIPPVEVELPDGTSVRADSRDADETLSQYFGHPVRLVSVPSARAALVQNRRAFLQRAGLSSLHEDGTLLDALPVSVLTTSSLDRLSAARPETRFDHRRFRMNVVLSSKVAGFVENSWPGRILQLGDTARLRVAVPVPRCALTTMAQEDLPKDLAVLRTVARENSLQVAGQSSACLGVYATVESEGDVRIGDVASLATSAETA